MHFYCFQCVSHAPPISFSLIWLEIRNLHEKQSLSYSSKITFHVKFKSLEVRDSIQVKQTDLHHTWNWKTFAEQLKRVWIQANWVAGKLLTGSQLRNGSGRPWFCVPRNQWPHGCQNNDNRWYSDTRWSVVFSVHRICPKDSYLPSISDAIWRECVAKRG